MTGEEILGSASIANRNARKPREEILKSTEEQGSY